MATQKKTAEVDYSMQEKIMALYELQKIDSKIDEINKVKGELPLEVQDLEDEMTGLRTRIDNINAEIEELNTLTKQRKREVDQAKILIGNYKEQQNNVRNNREFDAITKEIEYQELEIELAEKRLKEYSAGVKAKKLQLEEAEAVADGRAADLAAKKSELEGIEAETAPLVAEFEVQADRAKAKIDERLLAAYSRIRQNVRNGLAVVTVKRDACGGCFNRIPPQRQVEIRQGKKIIICESFSKQEGRSHSTPALFVFAGGYHTTPTSRITPSSASDDANESALYWTQIIIIGSAPVLRSARRPSGETRITLPSPTAKILPST